MTQDDGIPESVARPVRGGKFINEVRDYLHRVQRDPAGSGAHYGSHAGATQVAVQALAMLDDPETKRIVIDANAVSGPDSPTDYDPAPYRLPFEQMWIEFMVPQFYSGAEPGRDDGDYLIGMLVGPRWKNPAAIGTVPGEADRAVTLTSAGITQIVMFVKSGDGESYADRSFTFSLAEGFGLTSMPSMLAAEPWGADHASVFPELGDAVEELSTKREFLIPVRIAAEDAGTWENIVAGSAGVTRAILAFMTASGVVIVQDGPSSRQQRRALARMRPEHRPEPWHLCYVHPTHVIDREGEGGGRAHSFRYDVRGHWRIRRYRQKGGGTVVRRSWIKPHQRGVKNLRYVPKTYVFDKRSPGEGP